MNATTAIITRSAARVAGSPVVLDLVGATGVIEWVDGDRMGIRWARSPRKVFPYLTTNSQILPA